MPPDGCLSMPVSSWHYWAHDFRAHCTQRKLRVLITSCKALHGPYCLLLLLPPAHSIPVTPPSLVLQCRNPISWALDALPCTTALLAFRPLPSVTLPERHALTDQKTSISSFNSVTLFPELLFLLAIMTRCIQLITTRT